MTHKKQKYRRVRINLSQKNYSGKKNSEFSVSEEWNHLTLIVHLEFDLPPWTMIFFIKIYFVVWLPVNWLFGSHFYNPLISSSVWNCSCFLWKLCFLESKILMHLRISKIMTTTTKKKHQWVACGHSVSHCLWKTQWHGRVINHQVQRRSIKECEQHFTNESSAFKPRLRFWSCLIWCFDLWCVQ